MKLILNLFYVVIVSTVNGYVNTVIPKSKNAFDPKLYEEVLDPQLCQEQMRILVNNSAVLSQFLDASMRTPRGILKGNLVDFGNYYQCLEINENVENTNIEGKYCKISVPLEQEINWPTLPDWEWTNITFPENITWPELPWTGRSSYNNRLTKETIEIIKNFQTLKTQSRHLSGVKLEASDKPKMVFMPAEAFTLALCIPKPCTTREVLTNFLGDLEELGLQYRETACRLPNDKRWVAADYTAIVIFSTLGLLAIISTSYDIRQTIILKRDPKSVNKLYQSFSVYTNTRRLLTFNPTPGALECLDGVRSLAMIWVIIGHTFINQLVGSDMANPADMLQWIMSFNAVWITAGPITVDTFFMISGLLVVYTTAGKVTRTKFIKNVHLFYLNRLFRLFPVLAAVILLQASIFNRMTDGPRWETVAEQTEFCRAYWWSTLLFFQNFYNPFQSCLPHSWYLAIDFQLFLISPIFLFWIVSGRKRTAWLTLITGLLVSLIGATVYNFIKDFPSISITFSRPDDQMDYFQYYYVNTLTRCSPFFVGMIYGYMLHMYRGKKLSMSKVQTAVLWVLAIGIIIAAVCTHHPVMQLDWDNQLADNFINSFMRPVWALAVGWIVFACSKGYGGPVNWFLCLPMWKLLGRLSYAMYLVHNQLMFVFNGTALAPIYFSVEFSIQRFTTDFSLAVMSAFLITLFVDSPCSTLIKMLLGGGAKGSPQVKKATDQLENGKTDVDFRTNRKLKTAF